MGTRAAVGLVEAVLIAAVSWFVFSSEPQSPSGDIARAETQTYETDEGERARIQLGDGSQVVLNAKSTLTVPSTFDDSARVVELDGEALFTVHENSDRPFLVRAHGSVTRVLGTVFSVAAYPNEDTVDVVVAEGQVELRSERARNGVDLTARERGRLARTDTSATEEVVDPALYLAWTEGRLVFRDAPFHEVARRLGRQYGLEIRKADPSLRIDRLNATFNTDQSAAEVLTIIARTLSLDYTREDNTVTFTQEHSSD
jgi:ferric-dicitrate binding protein FerR (iron transport regulator)